MKEPGDISLQRSLPHSYDAERAVLGAILLKNECLATVVEYLERGDFYLESHRILFDTMVDVFENENKIDLVSIKDHLQRQDVLENVGGVAYLSSLVDAVPTAANVEQHSRIVQEKAILRKLIITAESLMAKSYEDSEDVDVLLSETESSLLKLSERRLAQALQPISKIVGSTFETIDELYKRKESVSGLPTGFADLDKLTSGLHKGDLIIVAARPAMGKTSFALNIAHSVALHHQAPVAVFSMEMAREQLVMRLLSAEAGVEGHLLRNGFLSKSDWPKLTSALARLQNAPVYIDDTPGLTPFKLRAKARRLHARVGLKLVVVDYLQLMQGDRRYESRQQEISDISRAMKNMAKELNIPVIALSQLSRAVETRDKKKRPQLSDLRESGAIEQDADLVLFLYRPEVYGLKIMELDGREEATDGRAEVIIAKHRNGPTGNCHMAFLKQFMLFKDLFKDYDYAAESQRDADSLLLDDDDDLFT
ncbi:replicative DNA helicase [bacterium]|nr:replicative DNA helicase [candidate division CSSED10-310 bacterium]